MSAIHIAQVTKHNIVQGISFQQANMLKYINIFIRSKNETSQDFRFKTVVCLVIVAAKCSRTEITEMKSGKLL